MAKAEARIIGVIAEQTKLLSFAKRSQGPIIGLWSRDHENKQENNKYRSIIY